VACAKLAHRVLLPTIDPFHVRYAGGAVPRRREQEIVLFWTEEPASGEPVEGGLPNKSKPYASSAQAAEPPGRLL